MLVPVSSIVFLLGLFPLKNTSPELSCLARIATAVASHRRNGILQYLCSLLSLFQKHKGSESEMRVWIYNEPSHAAIGASIDVHRHLGPGYWNPPIKFVW